MDKIRGRFCFSIRLSDGKIEPSPDFWLKNRTVFFFSSKAITLVELMISVAIVSMMVLSIYSIDTFSRNQVLNSDRRVKVQNDLSHALEHMSKYVQQARGDFNDPGIVVFPPGNPRGFQVRVDFIQTPSDLTDDPWVRYQLRPNGILEVSCNGGLGCPPAFNMDLSNMVRTGFVNNAILPDPLPANPLGFYVRIDDNGSSINIGLVGRFLSNRAIEISNPQVAMKTKIICNSCSAN